MFKSLYGRYIVTFASIILISFVILALIISPIINNYLLNSKKEIMERVANYAVEYFDQYIDENIESFDEYITQKGVHLGSMLNIMSANEEEYWAFVTDTEGNILHTSENLTAEILAESANVDAKTMGEILSQQSEKRYFSLDTVFAEKGYIGYAAPFAPEPSNSPFGAFFVCTRIDSLLALHGSIIRTVLSAAGWVLLACLVLVYILTDKISAPLKSMISASKSFASGNFDARITVTNDCDEVAELARSFNQMADSLQTTEITRRNFLANVSHDLRTPMTTISGFIDGILDGAIPPEKHEYYLQVVSSETKRLSRLVSQLLDLSRIQAGERKFTMKNFDICEMARQILISFEKPIDEKNMSVNFECDSNNMIAYADEDAIHQVLYNLCDNAIKFSPASGGELDIRIHKISHSITVSVKNKGQGIREEDLPFVFDRFYKADKSRGLDKSGVGLGLYISKTIMDAHRQRIRAESMYGEYCKFEFTLAPGSEKKTQPKEQSNDRNI